MSGGGGHPAGRLEERTDVKTIVHRNLYVKFPFGISELHSHWVQVHFDSSVAIRIEGDGWL